MKQLYLSLGSGGLSLYIPCNGRFGEVIPFHMGFTLGSIEVTVHTLGMNRRDNIVKRRACVFFKVYICIPEMWHFCVNDIQLLIFLQWQEKEEVQEV